MVVGLTAGYGNEREEQKESQLESQVERKERPAFSSYIATQ